MHVCRFNNIIDYNWVLFKTKVGQKNSSLKYKKEQIKVGVCKYLSIYMDIQNTHTHMFIKIIM